MIKIVLGTGQEWVLYLLVSSTSTSVNCVKLNKIVDAIKSQHQAVRILNCINHCFFSSTWLPTAKECFKKNVFCFPILCNYSFFNFYTNILYTVNENVLHLCMAYLQIEKQNKFLIK